MRRNIDAVLTTEPVPDEQVPNIGCSIKWISGKVS